MRVQAGELQGAMLAGADPSAEQAERNNELVSAVNAAVADFEDAQRRCANTLRTQTVGSTYRVADDDGHQEVGEFGSTAARLDAAAGTEEGVTWGRFAPVEEDGASMLAEMGHVALDVVGWFRSWERWPTAKNTSC